MDVMQLRSYRLTLGCRLWRIPFLLLILSIGTGLIGLTGSQVARAQETPEVGHTITVQTDGGNSETLDVGLDPTATDTLDPEFESERPPLPPSGAFDVRWLDDQVSASGFGMGLNNDIRSGSANFGGKTKHQLAFQPGDSATEVEISWSLPDGVVGTIEDIYGASYGPTTMSGSGSITVAPDAPDAFITLNYNAPPTLDTNAGLTLPQSQDSTITTQVLDASDADDPASDLTYTITSGPSRGRLLVDGTESSTFTQAELEAGSVAYDHTASDAQDDAFAFDLSDAAGQGPSGNTFQISVTDANEPPTASADELSTDENSTTSGAAPGVLENDSDPDGDALSVASVEGNASNVGTGVTLASGAILTLEADGSYSYDPNGQFEQLSDGQSASESFTYKATDGTSTSDTASVTITVNGVNDAPTVSTNQGLTLAENGTQTLSTDALEATDPDDASSALAYTVTSGPSRGRLLVDGTESSTFTQAELEAGSVEYEHTASDAQDDAFTFDLADASGAGPTGQTFEISVTDVNEAPTVTADELSTDENSTTSGTAPGVLENDSDPDGDALSVASVEGNASNVGTGVTLASGATLTLNADGGYSYDPNGQFEQLSNGESASESFTYKATDGTSASDTASVTITVNGVNDAPTVSTNHGLTLAENGTQTLSTDALEAADPDDASSALAYTVTSGPTRGRLLVDGTESSTFTQAELEAGSVEYEHTASDAQDDAFTFDLSDAAGVGPTGQTFEISVTDVNEAPTAAGDEFSTDENSATSSAAPGVLKNDSDPDGDSLSVASVVGTASNVGTELTLTSGATLTLEADGSFTYDPNEQYEHLTSGESASDSFSYTVGDGNGGTHSATVSITINGINNPPTITANQGLTVSKSTSGTITTSALSASDKDHEPSALTFEITNGPAHGKVLVDDSEVSSFTQADLAAGSVEYKHTATDVEDDTLTFRLTDAAGAAPDGKRTASQTSEASKSSSSGHNFIVSITATNSAPVAIGEDLSTEENTIDSSAAPGVLENDSDPDGDPLSVNSVAGNPSSVGSQITLDSGALLTLRSDGSYTYDPNGQFEDLSEGQSASDSFTYQVADGKGGTDTATATVNVSGTNDPPTLSTHNALAIDDGATVTISTSVLSASDVDTAPSSLTFDVVEGPTQGQILVDGAEASSFTQANLANGVVTYSHTASTAQDDSFTFHLTDTQGEGPSNETLEISISDVNEAPTITKNKGLTVEEGATVTISTDVLSASDVDDPSSALTFHVTEGPDRGRIMADGTSTSTFTQADLEAGNVKYEHTATGTRSDSLTFDLSDAAGAGPTDNQLVVSIDSSDGRIPVELVTFRAQLDNRTALLEWRTASETNNSGFYVFHKGPRMPAYREVEFVPGAGTTTQPQSYTHRVGNLESGTHQFQLEQVDSDGSTTRTKPVSVHVQAERQLSLNITGSNPVSTRIRLGFTLRQSGPAIVALYDVLGRKVKELRNEQATAGELHQVHARVRNLPNGIYFAHLKGPTGSTTKRIVVAR